MQEKALQYYFYGINAIRAFKSSYFHEPPKRVPSKRLLWPIFQEPFMTFYLVGIFCNISFSCRSLFSPYSSHSCSYLSKPAPQPNPYNPMASESSTSSILSFCSSFHCYSSYPLNLLDQIMLWRSQFVWFLWRYQLLPYVLRGLGPEYKAVGPLYLLIQIQLRWTTSMD